MEAARRGERPRKLCRQGEEGIVDHFIDRVGDTMTVAIPKENREWGYNPYPQGAQVKVVDYGTIHYGRVGNFTRRPGLYRNPLWLVVEDESGTRNTVSRVFLERQPGSGRQRVTEDELRIGDLPETAFWEFDLVENGEGERLKVIGVDYDQLGELCNDGVTPMPVYRCAATPRSGYTYYREADLKLVERGDVWKRAHGEPPVFAGVAEESEFHLAVGEYVEVRNPANGLFRWSLEEALDAISDGSAHGFTMGGKMPVLGGGHINVIRFHDEEVGDRVRAHTLAGFGRDQGVRPGL